MIFKAGGDMNMQPATGQGVFLNWQAQQKIDNKPIDRAEYPEEVKNLSFFANLSEEDVRDLELIGELIYSFASPLAENKEGITRSGKDIIEKAVQEKDLTLRVDLSYCNDVSDEDIEKLARNCPNIKVLSLSHVQNLTLKSIDLLTKFVNLIFLDISFCLQKRKDLCLKIIELGSLKKFQEILAIAHQIPTISINEIEKLADNLPLLKFLKLGNYDPAFALQKIAFRCLNLKGLSLDNLFLNDSFWVSVQECSRLQLLSVTNCKFNASNLRYLPENLLSVFLDECGELNDESIKDIRDHCKKLQLLSLKKCDKISEQIVSKDISIIF